MAQAAAQDPARRTPILEWAQRMALDVDRQDLPFIHETRPLSMGATGFTAHLTAPTYVDLSAAELALLPGLGLPPAQPEMRTLYGVDRKRPTAMIDIYPYRRDPATGATQRLADYRLELVEERRAGGGGRPKSASYPEHSKLASGDWYRFTVPQDGVYKLTYQFLQTLGVPVSGMESDRINVYGNHAGMLPFSNSPALPNDLLLNAVEVVDGGDGQFDSNDYILFYAAGPHNWRYNSNTGRFVHTRNIYSDSASYFIGVDVDQPKRVPSAQVSTADVTDQVTGFSDHLFTDRDLVNLLKSGRTWYGETYDIVTNYSYGFNLPYIRQQEPLCFTIDVLSRTIGTTNSSQWSISSGGNTFTMNDAGVSGAYAGAYADSVQRTFCFNPTTSNITFSVNFNKHDPISSVGWLNYIEVNARRDLKMSGDQLQFRDPTTVGAGRVGEFTLDLAAGVTRIWEITSPSNVTSIPFTDNGAQKIFRMATDSLREFIAFRNTGFLEPTPVGHVANQDLHATALPTDLVIVAPPEFMSEVQLLAERRADEGLAVVMATPQQIYNEFSSGQRDASAIKRFMKMLYDRAGTDQRSMPRYLLLFGDGSYNNLSNGLATQNVIPSYQSYNSWIPSSCYTSDDFYGLLDDSEGDAINDVIDIGVGRIPASSVQQAHDVVEKLLHYDRLIAQDNSAASSCSSGSDGGASDWRNWVLFASDDQSGDSYEGVIHMQNSDQLANKVEALRPCLNLAKIYLDAYVQVSTPGGQRYPDAEVALRDRIQKGLLLVNYVGHGGEVGWAHERLLDVQTIEGWTNLDRLPLFMTATCEFSRWDDPGRTSAGELVLLNPNGGGIGLMTTTRIAYSGANQLLAQDFYDHAFQTLDELGRDQRFGDIYRQTKAAVTGTTNYRNFTLLGDPSTRLAMARNSARITSITDTLGDPMDTIEAMATVRINGEVTDTSGNLLSDFDGVVIPTVFDKKVTVNTLANDGGSPFTFSMRKNIIYRGRVSVHSGQFSFTFVVPHDINYQIGPGRISIYAESLTTNACGYTNDPLVGGTSGNVVSDDAGPRIELFMNDERFVNGGITDNKPLLYAKLYDDNGINTLGSSIGHDLTATLDGKNDGALNLNDVYEADLNTYKSGKVRYRLTELSEGTHTLDLKAWDVFNNSSAKTLDFVVAPSAELALEHVLNYPNPFTTHTDFYFEHNRPCGNLDVQVQVFTVAGRLVKTLSRQLACDGYRSEPMAWDGLDDNGDKLGRGVYVYRLTVAAEDGSSADKVEKLVILR